MKRFIDLRGQLYADDDFPLEEQEPAFAFYDTIKSDFERFLGSQTFDSWKDFVECYSNASEKDKFTAPIERYKGLCPDWVFKND